jgi:hypothetical protein
VTESVVRGARIPTRSANNGSIELHEHAQLLRELRAVRTRHVAGRSSVVLPRIAVSHCDLAQALAIACFEHGRTGMGTGSATVDGEGIIDRGLALGDPYSTPFAYDSAM